MTSTGQLNAATLYAGGSTVTGGSSTAGLTVTGNQGTTLTGTLYAQASAYLTGSFFYNNVRQPVIVYGTTQIQVKTGYPNIGAPGAQIYYSNYMTGGQYTFQNTPVVTITNTDINVDYDKVFMVNRAMNTTTSFTFFVINGQNLDLCFINWIAVGI